MTQEMTGGCQCGRVRYRAIVDDTAAYLCHCRMCQRATGGVFATLVSLPRADVTWLAQQPDRYASSPIAVRGFCAACGTPLTYEGHGSDTMDLTVGSLDDPSPLCPSGHFGVESRHEAWRDTAALPDRRTDDLPHITARWIDACGKLPD